MDQKNRMLFKSISTLSILKV